MLKDLSAITLMTNIIDVDSQKYFNIFFSYIIFVINLWVILNKVKISNIFIQRSVFRIKFLRLSLVPSSCSISDRCRIWLLIKNLMIQSFLIYKNARKLLRHVGWLQCSCLEHLHCHWEDTLQIFIVKYRQLWLHVI